MGSMRIIILAVAAVAAIGLALVVNRMVSTRRPATTPVAAAGAAQAQKPAARVLVASHDLPVGTRLTQTDMAWQSWPADALNPAFLVDKSTAPQASPAVTAAKTAAEAVFAGGGDVMQAATGAIVREPILKGEPITAGKIVRGGQGGYMSVVLQPGMRAMAVPVTVESGAGGFILPGDRVDLLSTRKLEAAGGPGGGPSVVARTVLSNVRVLAIDQQTAPEKNAKSIVGSTATLEVPAEDVDSVMRAKAQGDMALVLRSYADLGGPTGAPGGNGGGSVRVIRAGRVAQVMTP